MKRAIPWAGPAAAHLLAILSMASMAAATSCAKNAPEPAAALENDAGDNSQDATIPLPVPDCNAGEWCSLKLSTLQLSLNGIWGIGPNDVWILGSPDTAIHWDGTSFTITSVDQYQALQGIWASGPTDIWTFGSTIKTWHYTGDPDAGWSSSTDDDPGAARWALPFNAIWGSSATDIWAVGGSAVSAPFHLPTVYHCDGWRDGSPLWVPSPTGRTVPPTNEGVTFNAIGGNAVAGVWIVGDGGKTRYSSGWADGSATWTAINSRTERPLYAVWASPNGDVWAGGEAGILHRFTRANGEPYEEETVTTPTTASIRAIWGLADDDVYAIGDETTVLHWDGTSWTLVTNMAFEKDVVDLFAIWGPSKDDLWLAGRGGLFHKGPVVLPGVSR